MTKDFTVAPAEAGGKESGETGPDAETGDESPDGDVRQVRARSRAPQQVPDAERHPALGVGAGPASLTAGGPS